MKRIEDMTINELKENGFELDESIFKAIYEDPRLRDLPRQVGLYGFFARYIVAESNIYFVFGVNQSLVFGEFVEAFDHIFPEKVVEKCGYFDPKIYGIDMLCPGCSVVAMPFQADEIFASVQLMEMLCRAYQKYKLGIPEYITVTPDTKETLYAFRDVTSNPEIVNNHAKFSFQMRQKQYLLDNAVWEWPIRPDGRKPGLLAFSSCSRYSPHDIDVKRMQRLYDSPSRWDKVFRSEECYGSKRSSVFIDKNELDFVCRGLDQMRIPYIRDFVDKKNAKADRDERQWYASFFKDEFHESRANDSMLVVYRLDYGAVYYWKNMYLKSQVTDEEREYGERLFYDFFDIRTRQHVPAVYTFNCPPEKLTAFRQFASENQIPVGFVGKRDWIYEKDITMVVPYEHVPPIVDWLHRLRFRYNTTHFDSLIGEFRNEKRSYSKDGQSVCFGGTCWSDGSSRTWRYPLNSINGIVKPQK